MDSVYLLLIAVVVNQVDAAADGLMVVGAADVDVVKKGHVEALQLHLDEVVLSPMGAAAVAGNYAAV